MQQKPTRILSEAELTLLQDYSWEKTVQNFTNQMQVYHAGIKEVQTKLGGRFGRGVSNAV